MKIFIAIFLLVHGIAHLVGFVVSWKLAKMKEMPYSTKVIFKKFDVGDNGIRIIGILWLLAAIAYFYSIYALYMSPGWAMWFLLPVTIYATLICIIGLPDSKFGILANLLLFVFLFLNFTFSWI